MNKKNGIIKENINRLTLGTVQFGLDYGVTNTIGKVAFSEVKKILTYALENGIQTIDTAYLYGESEKILGQFHDIRKFQIVTKTPRLNSRLLNQNIKILSEGLIESLKRLQTDKVYSLLLHNVWDLRQSRPGEIASCLNSFKKDGFVERIGASVYNSEEIDYLLEIFTPDIIQIPFNVFDHRLLKSGHIQKLKKLGVEIHVRSIFLQGILLQPMSSLSPFFSFAAEHLNKYHTIIREKKLSLMASALGFVFKQNWIDKVVIGVCSINQLVNIISEVAHASEVDLDYNQFISTNEKLLNPTNWRL